MKSFLFSVCLIFSAKVFCFENCNMGVENGLSDKSRTVLVNKGYTLFDTTDVKNEDDFSNVAQFLLRVKTVETAVMTGQTCITRTEVLNLYEKNLSARRIYKKETVTCEDTEMQQITNDVEETKAIEARISTCPE